MSSPVSEAFLMARAEAREMLFSVRALFFVLMYALIAGGIGYGCDYADKKADGQVSANIAKLSEMPAEERETMIGTFTKESGFSETLTRAMVDGSLPWQVVAVLFFSTFVIPGLILLVGFNRISEDIHTHYTRYVLQRVHRGSYLAGKMFGHWLVCFSAVVIVQAILLAAGSYLEMFELKDALSSMPRIWAGFAVFVLAYVAFNAVFSSMLTPPIAALMLSIMALLGLRFALGIGGALYEPLSNVWLNSWDVSLWGLEPAAVGVYLLYIFGFTALAYWILRRRDL